MWGIDPSHIMGMQPIWRTKRNEFSLLGMEIYSHVKKSYCSVLQIGYISTDVRGVYHIESMFCLCPSACVFMDLFLEINLSIQHSLSVCLSVCRSVCRWVGRPSSFCLVQWNASFCNQRPKSTIKKKSPQTLAHLVNFSQNVSAMFDNHAILLF